MQTYNFDHIIERRQSDSEKWGHYDEDVLPLWVADMDFPSPPEVIEALRKRVEHGIFGYPQGLRNYPHELPKLRGLIVERMQRLYQWEIHPEDIVFLPGVATGFNLACHALAVPQGGVLVHTPVYPPILSAAENTGASPQENLLEHEDGGSYTVNWKAFETAFTPQTRLFILCNPHNPVGKVFSKEELERIAEICLRKGIIICSDEIHSDLVYRGNKHIPIASLAPDIAERTITLLAPSKTFNLPGLQCSFAIIPNRDLRKTYLRARRGLVPWVNLMGLVAAQAAYQYGHNWQKALLVYLEANRDLVVTFIQENMPGIKVTSPSGTYLAWLDCREAGIPGNPYQFFLDKARVALNDGEVFGRGGEGFVRLNFGCPRKILEEALQRMYNALGDVT